MVEHRIRLMSAHDISQVCSIHARAFPGFFLTSLGPGFLARFYNACRSYSDGVALVAEHDRRVIGFVVGVSDHRAFHTYLRRNWLVSFGVGTVNSVLRKPAILRRFVKAAFSSGPQAPQAEGALLMSIAVDPDCESKGIGRRLLEAFGDDLSARGCKSYRLTTDRDNNDRVNTFYEEAGLARECSYVTQQKRWMNQYVCVLNRTLGEHRPLPTEGSLS